MAAAFVGFIWACFARHRWLFNFAVEGVAAQGWIVLLYFKLLSLELFVSRGGIARRRFTLFPRFGAFYRDNFPGHKFISLIILFL